ncbi:mersacidin/lichenicidin family type 2 lantibiotic [Nodularia sphaerocarpa]|uniref:mersacidin/lichenicidin family type 2 lantibiotic n=1 Tax=Nodularia sphaerocarpa TaxID=137816 RepID=UPI001EFB163F|nr:mersacidin/lichenicidin family type 2 lantibiotic [Nodularia sphaerocarpa]MDB9373349.1 mersacidin/lichenicidin family type 2 lantibiotic [Nodularia sphaerocarpa CS-585]MDB9378805.1 mersacidin/lichenicidin family type 2 lantibiotic [Nodularia sphaerocarpa CS-585A2]ULP71939.1 hypothetical protein BDGGKGIB_01576 [Nodularia sphaerocarpa UHCC 0038]
MSNIDIIRAWKDEEYRNSLSEEQRSMLPENPAGILEMADQEIQNLVGGEARYASQPVQSAYLPSWLTNCKNISNAMSVTSTCCCFSR